MPRFTFKTVCGVIAVLFSVFCLLSTFDGPDVDVPMTAKKVISKFHQDINLPSPDDKIVKFKNPASVCQGLLAWSGCEKSAPFYPLDNITPAPFPALRPSSDRAPPARLSC